MNTKHKLKLLIAAAFCGILVGLTQSVSAANVYKTEGERLLDVINSSFYDSSTGRYVDNITPSTGAKSATSCDCWPAANVVQALLWGTVNDTKYTNRCNSFIGALSWYINGPGYGYTHGGQRFFDDNGILSESVMRAWAYKSGTPTALTAANKGLFYDFTNKDANWGLPQTENNLGENRWYVGPGASQGVAFGLYYGVNGGTSNLNNAITFWNKINDPTMNIKTAGNLINEGVQYTNGIWKVNSGVTAGSTSRTINLGCILYNRTGDSNYSNTAKAIADALLAKWYTPGAGFNAQGNQGGVGSMMALCQMYAVSGDITYKNAAKDICDFLMNQGKDTGGYYPANGMNWNVVQTGQAPLATVDVASQACAAAALLCYAYIDINGHFPPIR